MSEDKFVKQVHIKQVHESLNLRYNPNTRQWSTSKQNLRDKIIQKKYEHLHSSSDVFSALLNVENKYWFVFLSIIWIIVSKKKSIIWIIFLSMWASNQK